MIAKTSKTMRLGDLIEYKKGLAFKSQDYLNSGTRIVRVSDTTINSIKPSGGIFLLREKAENLDEYKLSTGDIVVSTVGSRPPLYESMVGKAIRVPNYADGWLLNQNQVRLRGKAGLSNTDFLYFQLKTNRFIKYIETLVRGNANQVSITLEGLFDYLVPLPPLPEQKKIAEILSCWDRGIEEVERLRNQYSLTLSRLLDTLFVKNSKGWNQVQLGLVAKASGGSGFPTKYQGDKLAKIPFIKVSDMNTQGNEKYIYSSNNYVSDETMNKIKARTFPDGTVIFPKVGAALLTNKRRLLSKPTCIDNNLMAVTSEKLRSEFLYYWSLTVDMGLIVQNGALPSINQSAVEQLLICFPDKNDQDQTVTLLQSIDKHISSLSALRQCLNHQKQGLMQQLLTGKTRVTGTK